MPLYEFIYQDDNGVSHEFELILPMGYDFSTVMSPCGKYCAHKKVSMFTSNEGRTLQEKKAGTTKKRKDMTDFVKEQRRIRKKNYAPGTREHDSNEIWTGNEGKDGITQSIVKNNESNMML